MSMQSTKQNEGEGAQPSETARRQTIQRGYEFSPIFWRTSQYGSHEEAVRNGGVYAGETCYGYTCFVDSMTNAIAAAVAFDADANNDLRVHLIVDGQDVGDFKLTDAR